MTHPVTVAPTLTEAVARLADERVLGFTFVKPDGTERHVPFAELGARAARTARALRDRGVARGERVALVLPDGEDFVRAFLGAILAGAVPVPIYPHLSFKNVDGYHDTLAHIANAAGARFAVVSSATRPFVEPVVPRVAGLLGVGEIDALDAEDALWEPADPGDLAFLQFTSGSTSRPKGVRVTHGNLAANSKAFMLEGLRADPARGDKGVSWLPLFHDMGLIGFVIGPLFTRIPVVFLPTASFVRAPRIWLEAISRHRGTITYAPNFAYQLVTKRVKDRDVEGLDLSCLAWAGCGAEPIHARTMRDFTAKLAPAGFQPRAILASYGMAEATLAITFATGGLRTDTVDARTLEAGSAREAEGGDARELVDCGVVFSGHELQIVDPDGRVLGDREVGEIRFRGPSVSSGYHDEPELTTTTFGGGWLRTGDLGYTVGGRLFVCGRIKDIVIVRGRNFDPSDIEWAVGDLPGVRRGNVVAFGVMVDGEEELVVCAEATESDRAILGAAIQRVVTEQFALAVHDVRLVPQGTLPRTSSGKLQRRKARTLYEAGRLVAREKPAMQEEGPPA